MEPPLFQITSTYRYTEKENKFIQENFSPLQEEEMYEFWGKNQDKIWKGLKKNLKDHYIKAQNYTCPYCLQRIQVDHNGMWDAEHIIPRRTHPHFTFEPENLCISCKDCNGYKSDKIVTKSSVKKKFSKNRDDYLIVHPHFDIYSDHIKIISIAGFYLPKTDKGRTLVETCGLLRFIYESSEYTTTSLNSLELISKLNNELQSATTSIEQFFILDCIQEIAERAKKEMKKTRLENST